MAWESELAAWDASLPVLATPLAPAELGVDLDVEELFAGELPAEDTADVLASLEQQAPPNLTEMTAEAWSEGAHRWLAPPPRLSAKSDAAPGTAPDAGSDAASGASWPAPSRLAAPEPASWKDLARLLADECAHAEPPARAFHLHLGAARAAEWTGDLAAAEVEVLAALESPGVTSSSADALAAHRALWCLAERSGRAGETRAGESLQRLALAVHPDQGTYRALWAEWTLARAAEGTAGGAASAYVAAVPEGVARALAEAELVWTRPATASAILETAAHRSGAELGSGLLVLAAALTEHAGDVEAAVAQRFAALRLDTVAGRPTLGLIRDVARLEPAAGLTLLPLLIERLAPSELKVALVRWGGALALRAGEPGRALGFLFAPDAELGPPTLALERTRLDVLACAAPEATPAPAREGASSEAGGRPSPQHAATANEERAASAMQQATRALAAAWPSVEARVCLAWSAARWAAARPEARGSLIQPIISELASELAEPDASPRGGGQGGMPLGRPDLRWAPLAAGFETLARAAPTGSALGRRWWLERWAAVDGARQASAWDLGLEAALALPPEERTAAVDALFDALAGHQPRLLEGQTLAWTASAWARARGRGADAAAWLEAMRLGSAPWPGGASRPSLPDEHPFGRALGELAEELRQRDSSEVAGALGEGWASDAVAGMVGVGGGQADPASAFATWLLAGGTPPLPRAMPQPQAQSQSQSRDPRQAPGFEDSGADFWLAQPGPSAFWSICAATWAALAATAGSAGAHARAMALALSALADPTWGISAARVLRRLVRFGRSASPASSLSSSPTSSPNWVSPTELERCAAVEESALAWVEAAEAYEALGNVARAAELFERARARPDAATIAAELRFGGFRCGGTAGLWAAPQVGRAGRGAARLSDGDRALVDLEALDRAIADGRFEDAIGLLVDSPPHESAPTAETWAFAAELARAFVPGKPELVARLWSRAEDLALRPGLPPAGEEGPATPLGRALPALFRLADPGRAAEGVRRARALELLAELASNQHPRDAASAALFSWMGVVAWWTDDTDAVEHERALRRSLQFASTVPAGEGGPPIPVLTAWRRWLAGSGRAGEAALAAAAEAEALRVPQHRVAALLRAVDLDTELDQRRVHGAGAGAGAPASAEPALAGERSAHRRDWLREILRLVPDHLDAFHRLGALYAAEGRHREWSAVLAERLAVTQSPLERTDLHLARAACLAGPLADGAGARRELQLVLEREPHHPIALGRLVQLEEAAPSSTSVLPDLLRRQAAVEPTDAGRLQVFLKLGRVHLAAENADFAAAVAAFERVLELSPENREALEALSRLRLELGEIEAGLAVTGRLIALSEEPPVRARLLARVGRYLVRGGDLRGAQLAFRQALTTCPTELGPLDELLRLLDRSHDAIGGRFALDEVAHRLGEALVRHSSSGNLRPPRDEAAVARALASVMGRRGRPAAAEALLEWGAWRAATAGLQGGLHVPGGMDWNAIFASRPPPPPAPARSPSSSSSSSAPEPGHPQAPRGREAEATRRLVASLDPIREDLLFPAGVPPAFRRLCQLLGPLIIEEAGAELAERAAVLGLARTGRGPVSKVANAIWADLGGILSPGPYQLHLVAPSPTPSPALADPGDRQGQGLGAVGVVEILPGKTCTVVAHLDRLALGGPLPLGDGAVTPAQRAALRFAAGHSLFLAGTGLGFALVGPEGLLANWLTAVIRPFLPDYLHPAASSEEAQRWSARLARHLSRKTRHELAPFALECSTVVALGPLRAGILDAANRVGFVASGSLAISAELLGGAGPSPQLSRLLALATSDELDALVASVRP